MKTRILWFVLNLSGIAGVAADTLDNSAATAGAVAPSATIAVTPPLRTLALPDFTTLVSRAGPAVVNIHVYKISTPEPDEPNPPLGAPPTHAPRVTGSGSGFVISPNGVILTNRHVVADASKVTVKFTDKREFPAQVIGVDELTDVAVLKVEADGLPSVVLGDSSRLAVGQWVLAIGAPLGLERTATQGIISALGRSLPSDSYVPFIQTDVPINPGNSGGPLFDLNGQVVGINSQIVSTSGGYMGLSFAIPIDTAIEVATQILTQGHATHGWLGASAQDLSQELARAYGLDNPRGALINEISPASPAEKAGLQAGDIILAVDDFTIVDTADLPPRIGASKPGESRLLTLLRDGKVNKVSVRIGDLSSAGAARKRTPALSKNPRLGLQLSDLDEATRQVLGLQAGVLVEAVETGPAALAGVQPGDILLKMGRYPVKNVKQLNEVIARLGSDRPIPVLVKRQDSVAFLAITLAATEPR